MSYSSQTALLKRLKRLAKKIPTSNSNGLLSVLFGLVKDAQCFEKEVGILNFTIAIHVRIAMMVISAI